jgi:hypothetical protein
MRVPIRAAVLAATALLCLGPVVAYADQGCDGSHHSDTGHGANTDGPGNPYHNTCDGSASGNGNGNGRAEGRPCGGCVGNADDKNPPGQAPGASDGNAGYECDRNHGIARTNPAHTGCRAATVSPTVSPTALSSVSPSVLPSVLPSEAPSQSPSGSPEPSPSASPTVLGESVTRHPLTPASVAGVRLDRDAGGVTLPLTGGGTGSLAALAAVLVAAGAVLVACRLPQERGTAAA